MNVFTQDLGLYQGRISPDGNGYVYELGHSLLAIRDLEIGDRSSIWQDVYFSPGTRFIRAQVVIVTPAALPVGAYWEFWTSLDDVVMTTRRLRPSKRPIVLSDLRISTRDADPTRPNHRLQFALELVS